MVYTVTLNPALDYVLRLDEINHSDINRAKNAKILFGGKGINVSVILSQLDAPNTALGFVAGFTGCELDSMLKFNKITTDFVKLNNGCTRINVKIFAKEQTDINAPGPKITQSDLLALYDKLSKLKSGDILVLAGSIPADMPNDIYETIMSTLKDKGIKFIIDTTGDSLKSALKYKPFLIKPNHHELSELFGVDIKSSDEALIVKYAKELQKQGAQNVLVSRGKNGATLVDENQNVTSTGIVEGKPINNVGCGDSMVAGFIAGYDKTKDYSYALRLGSAAGNATAFCEGLASKDQIENIFKNYFNN